MKFSKLYFKFFLSSLGVFILAEAAIFWLYMNMFETGLGQAIKGVVEGHALIMRRAVAYELNRNPHTDATNHSHLHHFIRSLDTLFNARIWLTKTDGTILFKSFPEKPPRLDHQKEGSGRDYVLKMPLVRDRLVEISYPLKLTNQEIDTMFLVIRGDPIHIRAAFITGLLGVLLLIAFLLFPVTRMLARPLKQLERTATQIATGALEKRVAVETVDEIGELGKAFNAMAASLERMVRGTRELTANLSHELRTPLTRVLISRELLEKHLENFDKQIFSKHLDLIRYDIEEMDRLIAQMLQLSRLEAAPEGTGEREMINLVELLASMLTRARPRLESAALELVSDVPRRPIFVAANPQTMESALSNLLDNAIRYTPSKGRIELKIIVDSDIVRLILSNECSPDTGDDIDSWFIPFYRPKQSQSPGSGLGLAITRRIIENLGGTIQAERESSTIIFTLTIPQGKK